jgi:hypothetical protein
MAAHTERDGDMTPHRLTQITLAALTLDAWLVYATRAVWHVVKGLL